MKPLPDVRVGQVWRNCDKRMNGTMRKVLWIAGEGEKAKAFMAHVDTTIPALTKVLIRRMYPHSTGWELVKDAS